MGEDRSDQEQMAEFTQQAPALLNHVLAKLRSLQSDQNQAIHDLSANPFDLTGLDPHAPGAFGLGVASDRPEAPLATPTAPATPSAPTTSATPPAPAAALAAEAAPTAPAPAPEPAPSLDELLAELDGLIGLDSVKDEIHRQSAILRIQGLRQKAGLKDPTVTRHLVFVGNPGTGKTTVARLVGGIYRALGLLSKGHLTEVDRSDLVAGYLGQTAIKTTEVVTAATGGVLFIDEAYALAGDQYGQECINTLVKEMEDRRGDLVVIVAGYPLPMAEFIAENPGLESRFRTTILFPDYTDQELVEIFTSMAKDADFDLPDASLDAFRSVLARQTRDDTFGNGRFARNVFEAAIGLMAWRLKDVPEPTLSQLREILPPDVDPESQPHEPTPSDTRTDATQQGEEAP